VTRAHRGIERPREGIGTLWLLAIMAPARRWTSVLVVICWILLQGFPPIGSPAMNAAMSLPSQLVTIAIAVLAVWPRAAPD
jgi:hypothetical protein